MKKILFLLICLILMSSDSVAPNKYTTTSVNIYERCEWTGFEKYEYDVIFDNIHNEIRILNDNTELATTFEYDLLIQVVDSNSVTYQSNIKDNFDKIGYMTIYVDSSTNMVLNLKYDDEEIIYLLKQKQ